VLAALYLVFNEGYLASGAISKATAASVEESGEGSVFVPVREDLCAEAIRLTRLTSSLLPDHPETDGLLALMLLTQARSSARVVDGVLVTLDEQDRRMWDAALIDEGHSIVRRCLARNQPGPYQFQAAINAVHTDALDVSMTDWGQVLALYDQLAAVDPSPVVALNRAVAVAELDGPEVALSIVDGLAGPLAGYHAFHATRADLLRRLRRRDAALAAYDEAIRLAGNPAEKAWLTARRDSI
jgi:RNA polymerase sigma-70 factor (ECF subfamily)